MVSLELGDFVEEYKKAVRKHDKASGETGEERQRHKLIKSKHGCLNIAIGITFASMGIMGTRIGVFADTTTQPDVQVLSTDSMRIANDTDPPDANKYINGPGDESGTQYKNARIEVFHSILKKELIHPNRFLS